MEEDEDIKKSVEKQENYDEFNIKDLLDEINSLKKKLKFLENLLKNRRKKGPVVFVLIDSEASNIKSSVKLAKDAEKLGAASILVGGSSATDQMELAEVVGNLKKTLILVSSRRQNGRQ